MRRLWLKTLLVVAAALACVAASDFAAKSAGSAGVPKGVEPGAVTPSGPGRDDEPPGGLVQYFRATGENCYLVFSNFGLFGCYALQKEYGFHYNVGVYSPPEKHTGLYSWTDAPTLANYHNFVDTTTIIPIWLELPGDATSIAVAYWAKWDIEEKFDGVELEIAKKSEPTNWKNLRPTSTVRGSGQLGQPDPNRYYYEGRTIVWKLEKVDISSYKGLKVKLRFHFRDDMTNREYHHGIYVDDFRVVLDGSTQIYSNGFERPGTDDWDTEVIRGNPVVDKWGYSQALPAEVNFLNNGQFMVGASSSYVADAFEPDWAATSIGWNKLVNYSNNATRGPAMPEYRVDQYMYAYRDYVIVDCYVKNGKPETRGNIYAGVRMNVDIRHNELERDDDERVTYKGATRMAVFFDDGQLDEPLCGLLYLHPENGSPKSVNFTSNMELWTNDSANFTAMSNGNYDYLNTNSPVNRWAVAIGQGPHSLDMSEVFRFTFAVVGGDDEDDLLKNADAARNMYKTLPDKTPINVAPASFGKIKALYR
ncbi:MAG: hypothetical protein V3W11_04075 [bacterium]